MVEVTRDETFKFLDSATRNWQGIEPLSEADIEDVRAELQRFRTQSTAADKAMIAELKVQAFEALEQASDFAGQIDELNLAAAGKDARIAELEAENASLRAQLAKVREAAETLRQEATMHCQNSQACAVNHYGEDFAVNGIPGWINTSVQRIKDATAALSTIKGDE